MHIAADGRQRQRMTRCLKRAFFRSAKTCSNPICKLARRSAQGDISLGGTDTFFRLSVELLEFVINDAFEDPFDLIMTWPAMALSAFSQQAEVVLADAGLATLSNSPLKGSQNVGD
jgi:hypothetical protein